MGGTGLEQEPQDGIPKGVSIMYNVEPRIKIVGGIANIAAAVDARLNRKELAAILNLFGQRTAQGHEYTDTSLLIKKSLDLWAEIDESTADNITTVYTNKDAVSD